MRTIATFLLLILLSCTREATAPKLDHLADGTPALSHQALNPVALTGELLVASPQIGDPRHMIVQGDNLWIADHAGDPYLHLVDLRSGRIVDSRGAHGEGPGDFGEIPQLTTRPGDSNAIWAYDARLRRLTREPNAAARGYVTLSEDQVTSIWSSAWIDHDRLVGVGDMDTNRLMISDTAGRLLSIVKSSLLGPDSVSIEARRALSSAYSLCAVPEAHRIAMLYGGGGRIDIHDPAGRLVSRAKVPFPSDGEWALNERKQLWFKPTWLYYLDCAGTATHLYALFAGHRTDGPGGGRLRAARHIHVFGWNGELVQVLALDHEMSTIAVSGDTLLFATGQETQGVYRYRIPRASNQ